MLTEKDYCDYETCVALKELGFREKCVAYYDIDDNVGLLYNTIWHEPSQVFDVSISHNTENYEGENFIDAPTLYEAQKWLREERHLHIEVRWYSNLWYEYEVKEAEGKILDVCTAFKTYEEALSTAVYMAIEHLKENGYGKGSNTCQ
jgi:hypothetical protein